MGRGRAPCCDKNQVKRGPWSPAEDLRLITFIQKHGHDNWRSLPKQAGLLRCGKSCRLRWINYLRPDVKRGNFTKEEEDAIIKLHDLWGNKWSQIASRLPGRTDNEIKNVWNTYIKKRLAIKNSDHEPKGSCITSSSSSSSDSSIISKNQNLAMSKNSHGEITVNDNDQFSHPINDPKELTSSSSTSSYNSNNISRPDQDQNMDSSIDFGGPYDINKLNSSSDQEVNTMDGSDHINPVLDIPLETDIDFWNMLHNIDSFDHQQSNEVLNLSDHHQSDGCQSSKFAGQMDNTRPEVENIKWLRYLENELGLTDDTTSGVQMLPSLPPDPSI